MSAALSERLAAFEAGALGPAEFTHCAHVEAGAELLARASFLDAACRFQRGVETLARRAGAPNKANITITLAFLSLIAERMAQSPGAAPGALVAAYPELLDARLLSAWYSPERLASPLARRLLLMPDRAP